MSVSVTVQPSFLSGNGQPTTKLEIEVDCKSISEFLDGYDVLLVTNLVIATPLEAQSRIKQESYEFSEIYKEIKNACIRFRVVVYGAITDLDWIQCETRGVLVKKEGVTWEE